MSVETRSETSENLAGLSQHRQPMRLLVHSTPIQTGTQTTGENDKLPVNANVTIATNRKIAESFEQRKDR